MRETKHTFEHSYQITFDRRKLTALVVWRQWPSSSLFWMCCSVYPKPLHTKPKTYKEAKNQIAKNKTNVNFSIWCNREHEIMYSISFRFSIRQSGAGGAFEAHSQHSQREHCICRLSLNIVISSLYFCARLRPLLGMGNRNTSIGVPSA